MKYDRLEDYPSGAADRVRTVLLTAWPSIPEILRDDLVLVGGLAVLLHTQGKPNPLGRASATLDVDLGIALGASSGCYDTLSGSLRGIGFRQEEARLVREIGGLPIAIDFLVEGPAGGGRTVDDVKATSFPGIERALKSREMMPVSGPDAYGVHQSLSIPVASLGSLLVLKLNAFTNRRHPKDAYDLLSLAMAAPVQARDALQAEAEAENSGYATARSCVESLFLEADADGPRRALVFRDGDAALSALNEERREALQRMATMGRFLLGAGPSV